MSRREGGHASLRTRRGVALFEAMAALAIVGSLSLGVLGAMSAGTRAAERTRHQHEAGALAGDLYTRLAVSDESALRVLPDSLARGRFAPPFEEYTWQVESRAHREWAGLYDVQIVVEWASGAHRVSSALYRRPPRIVVEGR